uniref:procollagen-proline 4-dioxygenase n=1 Tax=Dermatophagoides pteronyssinus TaxID=6956 RepID=A0A6P6XQ51_DERPT|nr:prolyl 4-hydroxylase subunit alpha-1-like isoform X1 [Dermatophagoides pteronyssinus]XP_027195541.1 prolyl 4-hydroxylase subunit alpha-1-like isoform X2 [Dermatophagoides pteronyssinus]
MATKQNIRILSMIMMIIMVTLMMIIKPSEQEYYTALVHLEKLLKTEQNIVKNLNDYLDNEEKRLKSLKQLAYHYNKLNLLANQDVQTYLSNPVNAYLLVKRLTTDWNLVEYLIDSDRKDLIHLLNENETFPSAEDLSGAAEALLRLQDTYRLDTTMLANGVIPSIKNQHPIDYNDLNNNKRNIVDNNDMNSIDSATKLVMPLTANDCYELGRQAYHQKDYHHTVLWMKEALRRLDEEYNGISSADKQTNDRVNIIEHLAFASYQLGSLQDAYEYTVDLLTLNPNHERALGNLEFFDNELNISNRLRRIRKGDTNDPDVPDENAISESKWPSEENERDIYEALCRGENRIHETIRSRLKCYYLDTSKLSDKYVRLWRIKVEEAYKQPNIVLFIDFMSDYEINVVQRLAEPLLKRATVQNYFTGKLETAKYRISKSAWLTNRDHEVVYKISRRIQAITGLEMDTAEELQVVNYGIGGHYEPHYDFARREEPRAFDSLGTGNRIATWLNYMSNVQAGGATVFPHLGVTLWPRKNAAAFWYNLYKSGDGDLLTRHAACPVLVGSKWVSNKWIHEIGQEFRKPCGLWQNELNIVQHVD